MIAKLNNEEKALHQEFSSLARQYKQMKNRVLLALPRIRDARIAEKLGFDDIFDYALKVAGLPYTTVARALRLDKRLDKLPSLKAKIQDVGLSKVELVARVATRESEEMWVNKLDHMSKRAIESCVREFKNDDRSIEIARPCFAVNEVKKVKLTGEAQRLFNQLRVKMEKCSESEALEDMLRKLLRYENAQIEGFKNKKRMNAKKDQKNEPGVKKRVTRYVDVLTQRYILSRCAGLCEYTGCVQGFDNFHHKERFSSKKSHDSIVALCKTHHEIVHNGFIENEKDDIKDWRINFNMVNINLVDRKYLIKRLIARE